MTAVLTSCPETTGTKDPTWTRHQFRELNFTNNYVDDFSDLPVDVNGDGYPDVVSVSWFAKKIAWWKNPGKAGGMWAEADIDSGFPIEFALLADLDNDGKAQEVLPQAGSTQTPLAWYEAKAGSWIKHVVTAQSHGHGIGAGDVNKDGRTDILTPRGWAEAPADPRSGPWTFHPDWETVNVTPPCPGRARKSWRSAAAHRPGIHARRGRQWRRPERRHRGGRT